MYPSARGVFSFTSSNNDAANIGTVEHELPFRTRPPRHTARELVYQSYRRWKWCQSVLWNSGIGASDFGRVLCSQQKRLARANSCYPQEDCGVMASATEETRRITGCLRTRDIERCERPLYLQAFHASCDPFAFASHCLVLFDARCWIVHYRLTPATVTNTRVRRHGVRQLTNINPKSITADYTHRVHVRSLIPSRRIRSSITAGRRRSMCCTVSYTYLVRLRSCFVHAETFTHG